MNPDGPTAAWVAIVVAVLGGMPGIIALVKSFGERPRAKADAMALVNQRALDTMDRIDSDSDKVRARLERIEERLAETQLELEAAKQQLDEMEDRERRYRQALRIVVALVKQQQQVIANGGLQGPEHGIDQAEIDDLLQERRPGVTGGHG